MNKQIFRIASVLNTLTTGYQRDELIANLRQGDDNPYATLLAKLADLWDQTPTTMQMYQATPKALVRWHFTHAADDYWIVARPSDERSLVKAYGFERISHLHITPQRAWISIPEILSHGARLDLYFEPVTVAEITQSCVA